MKLIIGTTEYPLSNINEASLDDLMQLRKQTGLGVKGLRNQLQSMGDLDEDDLLDDPDSLLAVAALVWLARRKAGESLTLEQACAFPLSELRFASEPDDEVVGGDADPKSGSGSIEPSTPTSVTISE